ncbi:MAG: hypothetical protein JSV89_02495 [Spirochaetaceae bacterium]|nr:MAG: hypothetical protein JSV89_02495 [Spirochaetaceae bacterium]
MITPVIETTGEYASAATGLADSPIFPRLIRAADLLPDSTNLKEYTPLDLHTLRGRLVELSAHQPSAYLSLSCTLLLEAQIHSVPVVWISTTRDTFYPPDLAANGVDLSMLPVIWVPDARSAGRAADWLLHTGAFGLLMVDLHRDLRLPAPLQSRLAQLAHHHNSTVCFLAVKTESSPSLGSLISLYARINRVRIDSGRFRLGLQVVKDKRRAPVWKHVEHVHGPPGLR